MAKWSVVDVGSPHGFDDAVEVFVAIPGVYLSPDQNLEHFYRGGRDVLFTARSFDRLQESCRPGQSLRRLAVVTVIQMLCGVAMQFGHGCEERIGTAGLGVGVGR